MPKTVARPRLRVGKIPLAAGRRPRRAVTVDRGKAPRNGDLAAPSRRQANPEKFLDLVEGAIKRTTRTPGGPALAAEDLQACIAGLQKEIQKLIDEERGKLAVPRPPEVVLPELHDGETGRIDAQKVAEFMGVPLKRLCEGLGRQYKAAHRNPAAAAIQPALRPVKRSLELLHEFFGPAESIRAWLNTPHPDLGGASALETILAGRADAVALILENAWNGVPV